MDGSNILYPLSTWTQGLLFVGCFWKRSHRRLEQLCILYLNIGSEKD
ncbi:MAG: hypothetical protein ACTSRI_16045 [Promethearchaeota archaeon]